MQIRQAQGDQDKGIVMGWSISITEEMRAMGLSGNDLMVYALIHSCTFKGNGCYYGGINFLCEACGISRRTAFNILESLLSKGYITKKEFYQNGVKYVSYQSSAGIAQVVQNLHSGSAEIAPNNIENINISSIDIEDNSHKPFPFKKSLIEIGVSEEVAAAWMDVRKKKRATNSEIAFNALRREIAKSGMAPDDAVRLAVEKSWSGFDSAWVLKEKNVAPKREREDNVQRTMRAAKQLFGDNDPFFNFKKQDIDEQ